MMNTGSAYWQFNGAFDVPYDSIFARTDAVLIELLFGLSWDLRCKKAYVLVH